MEPIDYGVCRLAVVPVRSESKDNSEQLTQLLFGDHYEVISVSTDKKWLHIRIHADGYEGWLDGKQHHAITKEYFDQINQTDFRITLEVSSPVLYKKLPLTIVMGSIVPISTSELFKLEEQFAFNGESKGLGQKRDVEFLKTIAKKYTGAPFQSGGKSPFGIDHAAFVQMLFRICGYSLSRDVKGQSTQGKKVKNLEEAQSGDIAFFTGKGGALSHCGVLLAPDKIIHASGSVRVDMLLEDGILNGDTKVYTHTLHSVRRILNS